MTEHRMREEKNIRQVFHLIFGWLKILLLVAFLERRKRNRGDTEEAGSLGVYISLMPPRDVYET
ncbi:hypothetical protein MtrunA17_Chr3g0137641 [Medicago truncatula]|uniref:Transmembrane protein n=1 Tax=Medicago truncatula TaxID=3880 RepID=A0A396IYM2_MEDTR|nr:hypothetical protein MtrunA17_Chr3g0137641 [Medicago truncatula]